MDDLQQFLEAYQTTIGFIGLNAMLALSVWLTLYTGQLTLGNAAFAGIAAYSSALLTMKAGFPFPLALACGAVLAAAVSLPLGATVFRLRGVYLAIATLAFGEVVRVAILAIQPDEFGFARAVQILVFAVVGGIPNVFGPILGALLFTALPAILQPLQEYRDIFQGAILVLVIVFLPRGLTTVFELHRTARLRTVGAEDVA